jgi:hypothetical protein
MKKQYWSKTNALLVYAFVIIIFNITSFAQGSVSKTRLGDVPASLSADLRPFDFTDKYYRASGIEPAMLLNRRNGVDGLSVIDFSSERNRNNVRVLATQTAYGPGGEGLFWNLYAEFDKNAFTPDLAGHAAFDLAYGYPVYTFPSTIRKGGDRQSPIIEVSEGYFDKNTLGLGIVMTVEYNAATVREDTAYLADLGKRNGLSIDGSPIIRTTKEIGQLLRRNLVSITTRGSAGGEQVPFIVGKVIEYPNHGAITGDAFLLYIKDAIGKPLEDEAFFLDTFECMKNGGCK